MILYFFYGAYFLVAFAVVLLAYTKTKKHGRAKALLASGAAFTVLSLLYPIPVHGGFTFLFEIFASEMRSTLQREHEVQKLESKSAFKQQLANRFKGSLDFTVVERASANWYRVDTPVGTSAWYDTQSQLVWTGPLPMQTSPPNPSLADTREFCRSLLPEGYWALPTEAEMYFFWKHQGFQFSPGQGCRSMAYIADVDTQTELPTFFHGRKDCFSIRCVARSPGAPAKAYTREDISLAEWNKYQLEKHKNYE